MVSFVARNVWLYCVDWSGKWPVLSITHHGTWKGEKEKKVGKKKEERQCKKARGLYSELNKTVRLSCVICLTVVFIWSFSVNYLTNTAMSGAARCGRLVWGQTARVRRAGKQWHPYFGSPAPTPLPLLSAYFVLRSSDTFAVLFNLSVCCDLHKTSSYY